MNNIPFCLTNTIDGFSNIGQEFYHNVKDDNSVVLRPRIPLRYDFNDVSIERNNNGVLRIVRTPLNTSNTVLSGLLVVVLIVASLLNMRRILRTLQHDTTLTPEDEELFKVGFVLSFIVVLFLVCYLMVSWFELFRNQYFFRATLVKNGFRYKDITNKKSAQVVRAVVAGFILVGAILAVAEAINLFFMGDKGIFWLLIPIALCFMLIVNLHTVRPTTP
jgi:uncharacterized membrane protein (UPF0182 family)